MEESIRRGSQYHRPTNPYGWQAIHGGGRAGPWRDRPRAESALRAAGVQAGIHQPRISLDSGNGAAQAGGHGRASQRQHGFGDATDCRGQSEIKSGLGRHRRAAAKRFSRSQCHPRVVDSPGRRRIRTVDRVRQCCQLAVGARHRDGRKRSRCAARWAPRGASCSSNF